MNAPAQDLAAVAEPAPRQFVLSGRWTARGIGVLEPRLDALRAAPAASADATAIEALDSAGAWLLQSLKQHGARLSGLKPEFGALMDAVAQRQAKQTQHPDPPPPAEPPALERLGRSVMESFEQAFALLSFLGEVVITLARCIVRPARLRWRTVLYNVRSAGVDALPIVGLLSFMLGIVVAYQGAEQLRRYGANIFVADLVGLSMLREFAPLIAAVIIAGRSGSAYAAQIGAMLVSEEIDALRTLGIAPLELLVVPKLIALVIAMPLLTAFADVLGVFGGMLMASAQLDVGYVEFLDRFVKAVSPTAYLIGIAKAPVFAAIIVVVGCFQGLRTRGGADAVGRQTTRSVVQSIFLVIVADALFSVAFSALDL